MDFVEILVVEDNPNDLELTIRALRRNHVANSIVVARDGEEALQFLFREGPYADRGPGNPRVVLLDLKLPKIDGLEVLRQIRSHGATRNIPVVILTSSREERDVVESYELQVNSYVVKPVEFDKFTTAIGEIGFYWMLLNQLPGPNDAPRAEAHVFAASDVLHSSL
jgi:two-component system, response regulator